MKTRHSPLVPPPRPALQKLEKAACRDLTVARLTLGLIHAIAGIEPSSLFSGYHWRLCHVKLFSPRLRPNAQELMEWGVKRNGILNELFMSRLTIIKAVIAMRRRSPYGRRRIAIANRWRKEYPQIKPSVGFPSKTPLSAVEILLDEIGRPLGPSTLHLIRAFKPSQIEILAHDDGEYLAWRAGGIKIRLGEDGYTVTSIRFGLEVAPGQRSLEIHGVLEDFFETGTEGVIWSVVDDDARGYDALYNIKPGDHLTVQDQLGRKLWSGKIRCDRKVGRQRYPQNPKYGQPCALGHWIHWTQRGFKPDDWARYFIRPEYDRLRGLLRKKRA